MTHTQEKAVVKNVLKHSLNEVRAALPLFPSAHLGERLVLPHSSHRRHRARALRFHVARHCAQIMFIRGIFPEECFASKKVR